MATSATVCRLVLLGIFLTALNGCGGGDTSRGPTLADEIKKARATTDPKARAFALVKVSTRQRQEGDITGAANSMDAANDACIQIEDAAGRADVYCAIAETLANANQKNEASEVLILASKSAALVEDDQQKVDIAIKMARVYGRHLDRKDSAVRRLAGVQEAAKAIASDEFRIAAMAAIAQGFFEAGAMDQAKTQIEETLTAARAIEDVHGRVMALSETGAKLAKLQMNDLSAQAFSEAEKLIPEIKEDHSRGHAIVDLAARRAEAGQKKEAEQLLRDAEKTADSIADQSMKSSLLRRVEEERGKR